MPIERRFTEEQIIEMREDYWNRGMQQKDIAAKFETTVPKVSKIVTGKKYKDFPGPTRKDLSDTDVLNIRLKAQMGYGISRVADDFKLTPGQVIDIVYGFLYEDAPGPIRKDPEIPPHLRKLRVLPHLKPGQEWWADDPDIEGS